jgi:flagellar FliL protein
MAEESEAKEGEEGQEEAPKKKLPLPLILVGVQMLLLVLGGGVILTVSLSHEKPTIEPAQMQERAIASIRDREENVQTLSFDPFLANMQGSNKMQAKIEIEVSNPATAEFLKARLPIVKSQILRLLSLQRASELEKVQGKLLLKDRIREALNEELVQGGIFDGVVRDVYFTELLVI